MNQNQVSREATLREVLAEVSIVDLGQTLKWGAGYLACMGLFFVFISVFVFFAKEIGYKVENTGNWNWVIWLLITWASVHGSTSQRSFHRLHSEWYFPKLNWFGSLLLTGYFLSFIYLIVWLMDMEMGEARGLFFAGIWFGYSSPALLFMSVIRTGHARLMEKRLND